MPLVRLNISPEAHKRAKVLADHAGLALTTYLRPHLLRAISAEYLQMGAADKAVEHRKLIHRAFCCDCTTITEIVNFTGLTRPIVQTTLSELIYEELVEEVRSRGKITHFKMKYETL